MSKEQYDTFELAKNLSSLDYDEFIDLINHCGEFDMDIWTDLIDETIHDDDLSDDGKRFLKAIACYVLDNEVEKLKAQYKNGYVEFPPGLHVNFNMIIFGWWNDLWRNVIYG